MIWMTADILQLIITHTCCCSFKIKDLFQFVLITLFVVLGVGIYYHANLWPDHHTFFDGGWTEWRIWTILHLPYWQLYGEPNLDSLKGKHKNILSIPTTFSITPLHGQQLQILIFLGKTSRLIGNFGEAEVGYSLIYWKMCVFFQITNCCQTVKYIVFLT